MGANIKGSLGLNAAAAADHTITNTGSSDAVNITNSGTANALDITNSSTIEAVKITNNMSGRAIFITQGSALAANRESLLVYDNQAQTGGNGLVKLHLDNTSATIPVLLVQHDGSGSAIKSGATTATSAPLELVPQADPPAAPVEGQIYADTDHHLYYWNGSAWKQLDN